MTSPRLSKLASRPALLAIIILVTLFIFKSPYVDAFVKSIGDGYLHRIYSVASEFINGNTRDFLVFLAAALYMEWAKGKTYSLKDTDLSLVAHKISREIDCIDVNDALENSLKRKFYIDRRIDIAKILFKKPPLLDVKIDIKLVDDPLSSEHFLYTFKLTMKSISEEFIFALARSRSIQDRLCEYHAVSDVQVVPYSLSDEKRVKETLENIVVGCVPYSNIRLERIQKSRWSNYTPNLNDIYEKDYLLFRAVIPGSADRLFYELKNIKLQKSDHYVYWIADRLTYIEEISIDASGMTYQGDISYSFAPNILGYHADELDKRHSNGIYKVRAYQWVTYGQGVTLAWRKRSENLASSSEQQGGRQVLPSLHRDNI